MQKQLKIALCTAEIGCGHTRAATAVALTLRRLAPDADVRLVDAIEGAPRWFTSLYRDGYLRLVRSAPVAAGLLYASTDRGVSDGSGAAGVIERRALRHFTGNPVIREADVLVCTHFLCARVLAGMKRLGGPSGRLAVVVTDQHPHAVWRVKGADLFLVASERSANTLERFGVQPDRIVVTGIPIDARFASPRDRMDCRLRQGLSASAKIALITGGGLGLGGLDDILRGLLDGPGAAHAVVVCGHNSALKAFIERFLEGHPQRMRVKVLGVTNHMHDLMCAADIMVGKAGGLTTSEALATGLPMVLVRPIPGQEEKNAEVLVEGGAAELIAEPHTAGIRASVVLENPSRLAALRQGAAALGRARSTEHAGRAVIEFAKQHSLRPPLNEGLNSDRSRHAGVLASL